MSAEPATPFEGTVEVDETYVGGKPRASEKKKGRIYKRGRGTSKIPVVAVVERGGRVVASPVIRVTADNLHGAVKAYCSPKVRVKSDELSLYKGLDQHFEGGHHTVSHGRDEYVRYEEDGTTRTPTPSKASSPCSSAGSSAYTTASARATCTATWMKRRSSTATGT
jgi:hypothetical protein